MARPQKTGLDYFPMDVDFMEDSIVLGVAQKFGPSGIGVVVALVCNVYKNGYYTEWNDFVRLKIRRDLGVISEETLNSIVAQLLNWGYFDKGMFEREGVLTSLEFQKRYLDICTRMKRRATIVSYGLLGADDGVNSEITGNGSVLTRNKHGIRMRKSSQTKRESKRVAKANNFGNNDSSKGVISEETPSDAELFQKKQALSGVISEETLKYNADTPKTQGVVYDVKDIDGNNNSSKGVISEETPSDAELFQKKQALSGVISEETTSSSKNTPLHPLKNNNKNSLYGVSQKRAQARYDGAHSIEEVFGENKVEFEIPTEETMSAMLIIPEIMELNPTKRDVRDFLNYYSSRGWEVAPGKKVVDVQALFYTWLSRKERFENGTKGKKTQMKLAGTSASDEIDRLNQHWDAFIKIIKREVNQDQFDIWFKDVYPLSWHDDVLDIGVCSPAVIDVFDAIFKSVIKKALSKTFGASTKLFYQYPKAQ